ncbi:MAG: hypothetical protein K5923_03250 [Clostridia bacterium]|nr:hypothetical protein [Clostridia bacterium]
MEDAIKERLDDLMSNNNIATYVDLLQKVYDCSIKGTEKAKGKDRAQWAEGYKSNFTNALKGGRTLPLEVVIGLEHVLGTSYDYILNGVNVSRDYKPKGLDFVAYHDDENGYKTLCNEIIDYTEEPALFNVDEFGNNIMHYILKYRSINGLAYIANTCGYSYRLFGNVFRVKDAPLYEDKQDVAFEIVKLIEEKKCTGVFDKIFNIKDIILSSNSYIKDSLYSNENFLKTLLESNFVFKQCLNEYEFAVSEINNTYDEEKSFKELKMKYIYPQLKQMLEIAVNMGDYSKAFDIVSFGAKHNAAIIDYLRENRSVFKGSIKLTEQGFIFVDNYKIGNMLTYDNLITADTPDNYKGQLNRIRGQMQEIKNLPDVDYRGNIHSKEQIIGGYLYRTVSNNKTEYEMLQKMEQAGFDRVPKYYGQEDGRDKYDYISGTTHDLNDETILDIVAFLRDFHLVEQSNLGKDKTYVHGNFYKNDITYRKNGQLCVVNWNRCCVGDRYEDIINIIYESTGMKDWYSDTKMVLMKIRRILDVYGDNALKKDFVKIMHNVLENKIVSLDKSRSYTGEDKTSMPYKTSYMIIKNAEAFLDLYKDYLG